MLDGFFGEKTIPPDDLEDDDGDYQPDLTVIKIYHHLAPVMVEVVVEHSLYHDIADQLEQLLIDGRIGDFTAYPLVVQDRSSLENLLNGFLLDEEETFNILPSSNVVH